MLNYRQLPAWLETNPVFRKLYILRKLYLTQSNFKHHSQFAEDISIIRLFDENYKGFFVDVGCFHPKKYNNTWLLYKRDWRGINIDLDSIKIEGFNIYRPEDTNIASAVSDHEGQVEYFSDGFYSLKTSLDKDFLENNRAGYKKRTTLCNTLSNIIDNTKYKDREIDFLSVDAEGHDLQVLKSLDFDRYQPKLVAIESHFPLFSQVENSDLYQFLISKEYNLVAWSGLTLLMANPAHQDKLVELHC